MRILVTGSRTWTDKSLMARTFISYLLDNWPETPTEIVIVHGGAQGADRMADELFKAAQYDWFSIEEHPADWERYGKRAGYVRNAEMVELGADVCLAFIHNKSRGATMCADLAEKAGIPVIRVVVDDE